MIAMPDGRDWGLAWIRLERAIQRKLDLLEAQSDTGHYRDIRDEMDTLEAVQELMSKYEPKDHKRSRIGT